MNQGRFRWKPILLVVVGFAVFGSGWYLLHRLQMQSLHVRYREQAARAEETGNPDRAVRFLRQYLLVKGDDTDARARFAVLVEKMCRARKHYLTPSGSMSVFCGKTNRGRIFAWRGEAQQRFSSN